MRAGKSRPMDLNGDEATAQSEPRDPQRGGHALERVQRQMGLSELPNEIVIDGKMDRELLAAIALGALRNGIAYLMGRHGGTALPHVSLPSRPAAPDREVMTADEVAEFLGVDRNTVYDYAGRGVIPHQRLGKRILFRRAKIVSWLDAQCKAASTRKG
ncbi:MAG: helix-turn-helix domain-containing protein [Kofleriaceae bacterium]